MSIKCLINAGPTREYIDPVRFITNPSSGKFGTALAQEAKNLGWSVSLVLGQCPIDKDSLKGIEIESVVSAQDMYKACLAKFEDCDIFIASAAVCDMKPVISYANKIKKTDISHTIEFEPTIDVLKSISKFKKNQILVGFAAETDNLKEYALKKLAEKNLNCVIANDVSNGKAFEKDYNSVSMYFNDGSNLDLPNDTKINLSKKIVDILKSRYF